MHLFKVSCLIPFRHILQWFLSSRELLISWDVFREVPSLPYLFVLVVVFCFRLFCLDHNKIPPCHFLPTLSFYRMSRSCCYLHQISFTDSLNQHGQPYNTDQTSQVVFPEVITVSLSSTNVDFIPSQFRQMYLTRFVRKMGVTMLCLR